MKKFSLNRFLPSIFNLSFIFSGLLFLLFVNGNFFFKQQFFTGRGTSDFLLFFSSVPYILSIIIPVLCYKKNISVYDDFIPENTASRIYRKYFTCLIQFFIYLILLIPAAFVVNYFGNVDKGQFAVSLFCLLFFGSSVISFCILINQIVSSRLLSFVINIIVLLIINSIHLATVYIPLPSFLTESFKLVSFAWHFDAAGKGIIDTRDLSFFTFVTLLFLKLSELVIEHKKGRKFENKRKALNISQIVLLVLLLLNGQRFYKRFDFSTNKIYSLSKYTKELIKKVDSPLKITYYKSSELTKLYPQIRDVQDFLNTFSSESKNISFLVENPDSDKSIQENLESYGITSSQIQTINSNSTQYINVYSAVILEYNGETQVISSVQSAQTLEYDLDNKIKNLISGNSRTVNIVIGNGMSFSDENEYSYVVPWLYSQGFECNPVFIEDPNFASILESCKGPLLVIGDSKIDIQSAIAVESYILENKGNALFMVSPYSVDIQGDWSITENEKTNIVEMLENWGVQFNKDLIQDVSCSQITMISAENEDQQQTGSTYTQIINYPLWIKLLPQKNLNNQITLFWVPSLTLSENAEALLYSSPASYETEKNPYSKTSIYETSPFVLEKEDIKDKEKSSKILAAEINGSLKGLYTTLETDKANIVVIPDQYFINTLMTGYNGGQYGDYNNFVFTTATLLKLNNEDELASLQEKTVQDTSLYKLSTESEFLKGEKTSLFLIFILIPLIMIFISIVLLVKERGLSHEYKK